MEDRIHDWTELAKLKEPLRFESHNWPKDWTYGITGDMGARGNSKRFVARTTPDCTQDIYILPDFIDDMMKREWERGAEEAREAVRRALGI